MAAEASGNLRARAVLTLAALLPYWRFLSFHALYVTDDYFASDIFNGELPGRVLAGSILRAGEIPRWTTQLCSGIPLVGLPGDPVGVLAFALLPPAAAVRRRQDGRRARRHRVLGLRLLRRAAEASVDRLDRRLAARRSPAAGPRLRCGAWRAEGGGWGKDGRGWRAEDRGRSGGRNDLAIETLVVPCAVRARLRATGAVRLSAIGLHLRARIRRVRAVSRDRAS